MDSAVQYLAENFAQLRGGYVCAANAHTTVMAHEDPLYRKIQEEAVLTLPDGKPLAVIGKGRSQMPMEKITGTHFMQRIFTAPEFCGKKHYF